MVLVVVVQVVIVVVVVMMMIVVLVVVVVVVLIDIMTNGGSGTGNDNTSGPPLNLTSGPFQFQLKLKTFRVKNSSLQNTSHSEILRIPKYFAMRNTSHNDFGAPLDFDKGPISISTEIKNI